MTNAVKLSVAMCTYNGAAYLPAQLESIAAQTRPPDELVVCDDCSADATAEIVAAFAAQASFPVRLYVNERNLGSTRNFEQAIGLCAGDIIALADQDDIWLREKLARLEAVLTSAPSVGLVFSDAELVDADLRPLGRRLWATVGGEGARRKLRRGRAQAFKLLLPGWTVTGATMAFRAEYKSLTLPVPADVAMIHDGWIALLIGAVARVCLIEEPLLLYRQHAAQQIGAQAKAEADTSIRSALSRTTSYTNMLVIIERARERLLLEGGAAAPAVRTLEAAERHFKMRAQLPAARLRRLPLILRELLTLRYHSYGKGLHSAAKDFLL